MFKVLHERSGDIRYSGVTEDNHISKLIFSLDQSKKDWETLTSITRTILRSASTSVIIFEVESKTYWCKPKEFEVVKFALENAISKILLVYMAGSITPYTSKDFPIMRSSGIDGYQIKLEFN